MNSNKLLKKNILILGKCLDGGTGSFLNLLYKGMKNKHIIHVCVLEKPSYVPLSSDISFFNSPKSYPNHYSLSFNNILLIIREIIWLRDHITNCHIDICVGIDFHSSLIIELYHLLLRKNEIKTILTFHNNLTGVFADKASSFLRGVLLFLGKLIFSRSDVIIGISKELSNDVQHLFGLTKKPQTIYYGLPPLRKVTDNDHSLKNIQITSIARLDKQKDQTTLINAFAILINMVNNKNITLTLIGDGTMKNCISSLIKSLSLTKHIKLLGWKQNINTFLRISDIFILPSHREGFGLVLIEAMQHGIPVISSDVNFGPREILDYGKYGILVPMKDERAMAEAMRSLIMDKKLYDYYAQKSLERAKYFLLSNMIREYLKIIAYL